MCGGQGGREVRDESNMFFPLIQLEENSNLLLTTQYIENNHDRKASRLFSHALVVTFTS